MSLQDDKEYRAVLELLDGTGAAISLVNKLGKLAISGNDSTVKIAAGQIAAQIRIVGQWHDSKKFRVLTSIGWDHYAATTGFAEYKTWVLSLQKYCIDAIATQRPQWQVIATANGWHPAPPPRPSETPLVGELAADRRLAASEVFKRPAPAFKP